MNQYIDWKGLVTNERALRRALQEANIVPTLLVLAQLSGDTSLLDEASPYIDGAWPHMERIPASIRERARDRLVEVLRGYARTGSSGVPVTSPQALQHMMSMAVGQAVPDEYVPLLIEETRMHVEDARALQWRRAPARIAPKQFQVVIIGAGFSGITAGIRLKQAGIPFVILEKNPTAGGTWYENIYPGCGVDTASHFYSFSFRPNNDWSHYFAKRDEIYQYLQETVDHYGIREHMQFDTEVIEMQFDEAASRWRLKTRHATDGEGKLECNVAISAVGLINRPAVPDIEGLEKFAGPCMHTAAWPGDVSLEGKRVALIGTGASGMQVGPALAPQLEHLHVFQRSAHWVNHNPLYHTEVSAGQKWALAHIPLFSQWQRFLFFWGSSDGLHASLKIDPAWHLPAQSLNAQNHKIREAIVAYIRKELDGDEALIAKCVPDYPPYGKRMLRDNHWYKMLKRPNVSLVTEGISHVTEHAVVTRDGTAHEVDAIVMATGFHAGKMLWPMTVIGRNGVTIREIWGDEDPRAYKGITIPGFPNLFLTSGPNTGLAHGGSHFFHSECQIKYITEAIREMIELDYACIEVRRDAHDRFNEELDQRCAGMVWAHPGVRSWYKNSRNRVTIISPWKLLEYWDFTRAFDSEAYHCMARAGAAQHPDASSRHVGQQAD